MLYRPTICQEKKLTHQEIIEEINENTNLFTEQLEFLKVNQPINLDTTHPSTITYNKSTTHKQNTKCVRCSPTGVLSNKQVIVKAAGSTIAYDPEIYTPTNTSRNLLSYVFP